MPFWLLSPDWRSRKPETCDYWQTHWWRCRAGWGGVKVVYGLTSYTLDIRLTTEKNTEQPQSECPNGAQLNSAGHDALSRLGHRFAVAKSTGLLTPVDLGLRVRLQASTLDQHRYLPSCRTRGFLTSAYVESILAVRVLMRSAENGTPTSSWTCLLLVLTYQEATVARRRHLDCNTCKLPTGTANLHMVNVKSIMGRLSCLYSDTPYVMERPLLLPRRGPNTLILWATFFLTCYIWDGQVSLYLRSPPNNAVCRSIGMAPLNAVLVEAWWSAVGQCSSRHLWRFCILSTTAVRRWGVSPGSLPAGSPCGSWLFRVDGQLDVLRMWRHAITLSVPYLFLNFSTFYM
jgi:hypothetical protein